MAVTKSFLKTFTARLQNKMRGMKINLQNYYLPFTIDLMKGHAAPDSLEMFVFAPNKNLLQKLFSSRYLVIHDFPDSLLKHVRRHIFS